MLPFNKFEADIKSQIIQKDMGKINKKNILSFQILLSKFSFLDESKSILNDKFEAGDFSFYFSNIRAYK